MVRRDLISEARREAGSYGVRADGGHNALDALGTAIAELERGISNEEGPALELLDTLELNTDVIVSRHTLSHIAQVLVSNMDVIAGIRPRETWETEGPFAQLQHATQQLVALIEEHDHGQ